MRIQRLFAREAKPRVAYFDLYRLALKEVSRAGYPNDIKGFVFAELHSRYLNLTLGRVFIVRF